MSASARDQLERLLLALPHLADDTELPLPELAQRVGTTEDALLRDLHALGEREHDVAGFVETVTLYIGPGAVGAHTAFFKRPMRLTRAELAALDLGLGLLLLERPADEHAGLQRARRTLREASARPPATVSQGVVRAASAAPALPVVPAPVPDAQIAAFGTLSEAREQRRAVHFAYQRADATAAERRLVHPWALVRAHQHVYVVAWCTGARALRLFRLDRISDVQFDHDTFDVPATFDPDSVVRDGRAFVGELPDDVLVVRYTARIARWISEREGVPLDADGSVTVSWPLADDDWAVRHVLQYGPDAAVLGPARIAEAVRAVLASLVAASGEAT